MFWPQPQTLNVELLGVWQSKKRSKFQKALSLSQKKVAVVENKKLNKFADQVLVLSLALAFALSLSRVRSRCRRWLLGSNTPISL